MHAPTATRSKPTTAWVFFCFVYFWFPYVAFPEYLVPLTFRFCMESTLYVVLPEGGFLPCDQGLGFDTSLCICMVIPYIKGKDQPGKVANPARGQLNR